MLYFLLERMIFLFGGKVDLGHLSTAVDNVT